MYALGVNYLNPVVDSNKVFHLVTVLKQVFQVYVLYKIILILGKCYSFTISKKLATNAKFYDSLYCKQKSYLRHGCQLFVN